MAATVMDGRLEGLSAELAKIQTEMSGLAQAYKQAKAEPALGPEVNTLLEAIMEFTSAPEAQGPTRALFTMGRLVEIAKRIRAGVEVIEQYEGLEHRAANIGSMLTDLRSPSPTTPHSANGKPLI